MKNQVKFASEVIGFNRRPAKVSSLNKRALSLRKGRIQPGRQFISTGSWGEASLPELSPPSTSSTFLETSFVLSQFAVNIEFWSVVVLLTFHMILMNLSALYIYYITVVSKLGDSTEVLLVMSKCHQWKEVGKKAINLFLKNFIFTFCMLPKMPTAHANNCSSHYYVGV